MRRRAFSQTREFAGHVEPPYLGSDNAGRVGIGETKKRRIRLTRQAKMSQGGERGTHTDGPDACLQQRAPPPTGGSRKLATIPGE
jgi:hypothetical protein